MQIKKFIYLFLPVVFVFSSCDNAADPTVNAEASQKKTAAPTAKNKYAFLSKAEKEMDGDFNGDGKPDKLYLIETAAVSGLKNVSAKMAWTYYGEGDAPVDLSKAGPYALVVVEGPDQSNVHLLYDPNEISILAALAASEMFVVKKSDKTNQAWIDLEGAASGDVLVIPTEAGIDTYFGWNGNEYISFELLEMP